MKNLRPRGHQEERESSLGSKNYLLGQGVSGLSEKDDEDGMGVLRLEMEDWYREEENCSMVGAA